MFRVRARLIGERECSAATPEGWGDVRCRPDGDWEVRAANSCLVLDAELRRVRRRFDLPVEGAAAVCFDLQWVAVAGRDRIALADPSGGLRWQVIHPVWTPRLGAVGSSGSCVFSHDGRQVWAVVPGDAYDELWVMETDSGRVLDRATLGCATTGSTIRVHPDRDHLGIDLGAPYYGWIGWGRWAEGRAVVRVRESPYEVLTDIHPSGQRYLTTPIEDDVVVVRRFGDDLVEASRSGSEVFGEGLSFDTKGGYLDAKTVVAMAFEGPTVLLTADTLSLIGYLDYPDDAVSQSPRPNGRGTWTTFDPEIGRVQLWRL